MLTMIWNIILPAGDYFIIIIIIEAFIKRRITGKTTCSKALEYRGSYTKLNKVISSDKLYNQ